MTRKALWVLLVLLILGGSALYFSTLDNYSNQDVRSAPVSKTLNTLLHGGTTKFPSSTNAALRLKPVASGAAAELTAEQLDDAHDLVKRLLLVDDAASSSAEKTLPERLQSGLNRLQESASDEIRASFSRQKTLNGLYGRIPVQSVSLDNPESFSMAVERKVADFPELFMNSGEMNSIGVESSCGKHLCTTVVKKSYKGIEAWDYSLNFVSSDRNIVAVQGEFETPVVSGLAELQMGEQEYLDIVNSYFGLDESAIESGTAVQFGIDRHGAHDYFALKAIVVARNGFRRIVYVSQESKKVIRDSDLVHTEGVEAEGLNLLGELVQFQAEAAGDIFEMSDTRFPKGAVTDIRDHSATVITKDFLGRTIFTPDPLVSDRGETIIKSSSVSSGWDAAAVSAMEGTKDLYYYFSDTHGFPGDSELFPVTIFVNGNYSNAISFGNGKFAYGRGDGTTERNFAIAKDIIAHEVTHGVISAPNMSRLEYSFESGALNESLADFFGAIVGDGNWTMGEAIRIDGRPSRSMSSPSSYGDPAHYSDRLRVGIEIDRGGVHSNSGIPNRMFYLLAEGLTAEGIGTSIGREKTAALAFVLIKSLKPTKATFQQAADLMVSAAIDIYGDGVGNSVRDAWKAVGIPDETVTFSSLETGTEEKPTANVLAYLYPNFSISTYGIQNNSYALYLQAYSSELKSFEADLNVGPFNTFQARFTKPILVPKEDGNVLIAYQDTSGIFRVFNSKSGETNALVVDGVEFSAITVSTDSRYVAFSVMDSPNIYILDNETDSASTVTVRMTTNTEGVLGPPAEYVDAIAFDPTGRKIVFDFLTCEDQGTDDCVEQENKYWSIGVLDVQDLTLDFPFPQQPSTIDVGFPSFSNLNDRHIVFDLIHRDADVESGIISLVTIYDTLENSLQLGGLPDLSSAQLGALGVPSFSADDTGVIHATRFDSGNSLLYFQDIVDYEAVDIEDGRNELNPFLAFMPISVPAVSQDKKPQLVIDQSSLDFGEIIIGSKKGAAACISNAGRFSIEIKGVNTEFDDLSWDGTGVDLDAGRQFCGQFIFDSSDRDVGPLESTISIKHNGSNSPTPVSFKAYFDIDTDEDGIGNNTDTDDDNDETLDADDAFPFDASESLDSDGDGIGNNADTDDDNDEVLDGDDAFPFDASESIDTDGDGVGNNADSDDDGDGVLDSSDGWPLDNRYSLDSDSDGMPDAFEDSSGLNKYIASDADSDADNDELSALQEFLAGTSPLRADSDFDTLPDGWEVANGRDPLVADYHVSAGEWHTCAIDDTGVVCWGADVGGDGVNDFGQTDVPALVSPTKVSASSGHTCAVDASGLVCWGSNGSGNLDIPSLYNPTQVSDTCAIHDNGVACWGRNVNGEKTVPELSNPTQVSRGWGSHTCALDDTGVVCWGYNSNGQTTVPALSNPTQVSAGGGHTCAVDDTGVVCWGALGGTGSTPALSNPIMVDAGVNKTCALDDTGIVCWGNNTYGDLTVPELSNPRSISKGRDHTCALDDNGVVCWGRNWDGRGTVPLLTIDPDGDGYSNQGGADTFPLDSAEWLDTDSDGIGNNADPDDDNDSVLDSDDAFPLDASESADTDGDGVGDNADAFPDDANETLDSDLDNVGDNADNCVDVTNTDQLNSDDDLLGNACDEDDDNDGVSDEFDALPLDASEQIDTDADGIGNNADDDDDNDGVIDNSDAYPLNSLYSADSDGDGMADAWELLYGLDPNDPSDASSDVDNDGAVALQAFIEGTIPSGSLDIDGNENYDALTDGLLLLRGMFGLDGSALVTGTIASDAAYTESVDIESRIATLGELADIDGNGDIDALTDGLLTLRYLFGLQGDMLINGVVAEDATRKTAEEIEAHLETLMPAL